MTLPPSRIGDKGQRYQVEAKGYPKDETWAVVGWSGTPEGAKRMADGIALHPSCEDTRIIDREACDPA